VLLSGLKRKGENVSVSGKPPFPCVWASPRRAGQLQRAGGWCRSVHQWRDCSPEVGSI